MYVFKVACKEANNALSNVLHTTTMTPNCKDAKNEKPKMKKK